MKILYKYTLTETWRVMFDYISGDPSWHIKLTIKLPITIVNFMVKSSPFGCQEQDAVQLTMFHMNVWISCQSGEMRNNYIWATLWYLHEKLSYYVKYYSNTHSRLYCQELLSQISLIRELCHERTHSPSRELINVLQTIGTHTTQNISVGQKSYRSQSWMKSINIKACVTFALPPVHPNTLQDAEFREDREIRCLKDKLVSLFHL